MGAPPQSCPSTLKASFPDPRPALEGVPGSPGAEGWRGARARAPRRRALDLPPSATAAASAAAGRGAEGGERKGAGPGQEGGREGAGSCARRAGGGARVRLLPGARMQTLKLALLGAERGGAGELQLARLGECVS